MTKPVQPKKTRKPNNSPEITARKRKEGKNLGGRPKFQIKYKKLGKLCRIFCTGDECASRLGCSYETLNLRLQEDYQQALKDNPDKTPNKRFNGFQECFKKLSAGGRESLRRQQFKIAMGEKDDKGNWVTRPDKGMLIFLGKNYLEQSDRIDHTTKGEKLPTGQTAGFDFTQLPDGEFLQLGELLKKARQIKKPKKPDEDNVH